MTMGLLAYTHLEHATAAKTTRAQLQVAQSLLDEYNAGPGVSQMGMGGTTMDQFFPYQGGYYPSPKSPKPIGVDSSPLVSAGAVGPSTDDRDPNPHTPTGDYIYGPPPAGSKDQSGVNAVYNTAVVM